MNSLSQPLQALLILVAIPPVGFLLFADYERRLVDRLLLLRELQKTGRAMIELQKVRLVSLIAMVFQLALFLGSGRVRAEQMGLSLVAFLSAIVIQAIAQARLEGIIRLGAGEDEAITLKTPRGLLLVALKGIAAIIVGAVLYAFCVLGTLKLTALIFGKEHPWLFFVAGWLGIFAGLALNFALGRFFLRFTIPARRIGRDEPEWELLRDAFSRTGRTPPAYVWSDSAWSPQTVVIAGFRHLPGSLALFISPRAFKELTPQELHAVFCHEAAHQYRSHLLKRLGLALALIFMSTLSVTALLVLGFMAARGESGGNTQGSPMGLGALLAFTAFLITFKALAGQSQAHELEADRTAIQELGADTLALISALRKIDQFSLGPNASTHRSGAQILITHPDTEARIDAIRAASLSDRRRAA